jgi:hypothetical protein
MPTISQEGKRFLKTNRANPGEGLCSIFSHALISKKGTVLMQVNADDTLTFPGLSPSVSSSTTITGSLTVSTTAAVTGAATFGSTVGITGNVAVNTDKFTVAASSGNTLVAGTLNVTGAQTFTGNTTHSGTLAVTGAQTLAGATTCSSTLAVAGAATLSGAANVVGAFSVNTDKLTVAAASGNTAIAGTLAVTGASTLAGNVACSGALAVVSTSSFGGKLFPTTDDGAALGDTTHHFSDLFLASGGVLNFNNGNWAATHTSGILTVGTGDLRVTTAGTNAASVVTIGGTQTLTAKTLTSPTLTAPAIGAATGTSLTATGLIASTGTAGVGYATGAGGTVTQITSITTGVTLDKTCGTITTVSSTLAAGVDASFTLTNSTIAATDVVVASIKSYGGTSDGIPVVSVQATAAGSCVLNIRNTGAVTLDAVIVISYAVIKAVAT